MTNYALDDMLWMEWDNMLNGGGYQLYCVYPSDPQRPIMTITLGWYE